MFDTSSEPRAARPQGLIGRFHAWRTRLISSAAFQSWAASTPLVRGIARRDAARLYDLTAGFVYSQVLLACVELRLFDHLADRVVATEDLAQVLHLPADRVERLCQAAAALDLLVRTRDGAWRLGRLGAAVRGVPGLPDMIRHHAMFYRDLADPVALLRGRTEPELSRFWPYVLGGADGIAAEVASSYSDLMASSQTLVAEETLAAIDLRGHTRLMDVGGGTGAFLSAALARTPGLEGILFDLPQVVAGAPARLDRAGMADRVRIVGGSFRTDPLPRGADVATLVRVAYDHDDDTVRGLLMRLREALPPGGRLVISEPMSGGERPSRAGDAYFGLYTLAMTTGRARSARRHCEMLTEAGFDAAREVPTRRGFITGCVEAVRPR